MCGRAPEQMLLPTSEPPLPWTSHEHSRSPHPDHRPSPRHRPSASAAAWPARSSPSAAFSTSAAAAQAGPGRARRADEDPGRGRPQALSRRARGRRADLLLQRHRRRLRLGSRRAAREPLRDNGKLIGTHFGGPRWQARDGSTVVGSVAARVKVARDDRPVAALRGLVGRPRRRPLRGHDVHPAHRDDRRRRPGGRELQRGDRRHRRRDLVQRGLPLLEADGRLSRASEGARRRPDDPVGAGARASGALAPPRDTGLHA